MTRGIRDEDAERRRDEGEPVTIENVRAIATSDYGLKCRIEDEGLDHEDRRTFWVSQNHITDDSEVYQVDGDIGKLIVTAWMAGKLRKEGHIE